MSLSSTVRAVHNASAQASSRPSCLAVRQVQNVEFRGTPTATAQLSPPRRCAPFSHDGVDFKLTHGVSCVTLRANIICAIVLSATFIGTPKLRPYVPGFTQGENHDGTLVAQVLHLPLPTCQFSHARLVTAFALKTCFSASHVRVKSCRCCSARRTALRKSSLGDLPLAVYPFMCIERQAMFTDAVRNLMTHLMSPPDRTAYIHTSSLHAFQPSHTIHPITPRDGRSWATLCGEGNLSIYVEPVDDPMAFCGVQATNGTSVLLVPCSEIGGGWCSRVFEPCCYTRRINTCDTCLAGCRILVR
jgi:hypothetical protein